MKSKHTKAFIAAYEEKVYYFIIVNIIIIIYLLLYLFYYIFVFLYNLSHYFI